MGATDPDKRDRSATPGAVHPDAHAGAGGPGYFRDADGFRGDEHRHGTVRHAKSPAARLGFAPGAVLVANAGATAVAARTPPATKPLQKQLAQQSGPEVNMDVRVQVLADKRQDASVAAQGAKTRLMPSEGLRLIAGMEWRTSNGKIARITKKLVVRGTYTIRTSYGRRARPTDPSRYGRGTTPADKASGNVSLGFHEWCHQQEYLDYLLSTPFPKFTGKVGMSEADFEAAVDKFNSDFAAFGAGIAALGPAVDEVGYTKSQCQADGKC